MAFTPEPRNMSIYCQAVVSTGAFSSVGAYLAAAAIDADVRLEQQAKMVCGTYVYAQAIEPKLS